MSNGDVILFLHGRFGKAGLWRSVMRLLGDRYHCIAQDLPENSSWLEHAAWVRGILERPAISGRRVFLVGHDSGAAIALLCAILGARISGLCLLNGVDLTGSPKGFKSGWFGLGLGLLSRSISKSPRLGQGEQKEIWSPWLKVSARREHFRSLKVLHKSWPMPETRELWEKEIYRLKIPILVLRGALDPLNSREFGLKLLRSLPDTLYFEEESCGHWALLEHPEWVASKLQTFFFHTKAA